ncbi:interferon-induced protein 44-like [Mercenaria mercenaria]|uniref:interferon-induced protein 44-like n=1 Tax=Mercenaria mercenaria TaxID=6596 RepID=UPI00234F90B1|nr:interferon-induced protein 44-like [Mercenaria mercenaria]
MKLQYIPYTVKVKSGGSLNFRLCDTRGLEESMGIDVLECNYLLDGNVPAYYELNPTSPISPKYPGFKSDPSIMTLSIVQSSPTVKQAVEKASQILGLPRAHVLPVKNYEDEAELDDNIDILALLALRKMLHFTEDFMHNLIDKRNDVQVDMKKLKLEN